MDIITLKLAKNYTDSKLNVGMFVGTVPPGGAFPTTRLDGSPLQNEDFVKPLTSATFPYTVGTVTFQNKFTQGLYLSGTWVANPGAIQDTAETPVKSPALESISGTSSTQAVLNAENKAAIQAKVPKTTDASVLYGTDTSAATVGIPYAVAETPNNMILRDPDGRAKIADPAAAQDIASKHYVDTTTIPKMHDLTHAGDLINVTATGAYGYKDPADLQPVWGNITGTLADQNDLNTALGTKTNVADIRNNVTSTDTDKPLSAKMGKELQEQISSLSSMGRFLSTWNCRTGLPSTNPTVMPYSYKTGDYYIVSQVATVGGTNYKPNGNQYTGTASTTVESGEVHENDFYQYDGATWMKLSHSGQTVVFSQIAGDPYSNTNLATALNEKYVKPTMGIPKTDLATDVFALYRMASEQDIIDADKVDKVTGKGLSTDDFNEDLYYNKITVDMKIASITATFRGSFATKAALLAYAGEKNRNDYAYVEVDESHSNQKWRYTYDGAAWQAEFRMDGNAVWGTIGGAITDQADLIARYYDKTTMDEKLATNSATFRGAFANKAALVAYAGDKVKNDYAVVLDDESHDHECWRYKYDASAWISEYRVNESAITTEQYAAMNSGITQAKVLSYDTHKNATNNPHAVTKAQIGLGDVNNTADADKPISTLQQVALDTKITNPSGGTNGQILQKTASGEAWANQYPSGSTGQILQLTGSGAAWADQYPTGTEGEVLRKTSTGVEWDDQYPTLTAKKFLRTKDDASDVEWADPFPATGDTGNVLVKTADGQKWAQPAPVWESEKAYDVGDRVSHTDKLFVLKCKTAGTSGTTRPLLPITIESGITELTDGTVTWVIYDVTNTDYIPQLAEFPTMTDTSPKSFQYVGTDTSYEKFHIFGKHEGAYSLTCTFGTFYTMVMPESTPVALYDDEECTVLNADHTARDNGAQIIVTKISTSETANANLGGGPGYVRVTSSPEEVGEMLPLAGGTMTGAINMGSQKITSLATPTDNTDAATKAYADKMLPLTGGTMTGKLMAKAGGGLTDGISTSVDNSQLMICGGTDNTGATIWLNGKSRSGEPGCFNIRAMTNSVTCDLFGNASGGLFWCGNPVSYRRTATITFSLESGFSVSDQSAIQIAQGIYYVMFTVTCSSAISSYKKFSDNGIKIDNTTPYKRQVLAGASYANGATVNLAKNTSANWWVGIPSEKIAANDPIYFSGIVRIS